MTGPSSPAPADDADLGHPPPGENFAEIPPVQWGRIFKYGFRLLSVCPWLAAAYAALFLVNESASLAAAQLVGTVTNELNQTALGSSPDGLAASYWLWVAVGLVAVVMALPISAVSESINGAMMRSLQGRLFRNVLRQSPDFFHRRDSGSLTAVINHMSQEAQITLREVIMEPLLQILLLGITTALLIYNFLKIQGENGIVLFGLDIPAPAIPVAILAIGLTSPYLIRLMGRRIRTSSGEVRDRSLHLASLVTGAMQAPEEIQAMNAESFFGKKHASVLRRYARSRIRQSIVMEVVNILNSLPVWFVPAALLGMAVAIASSSPDPANVGNVVAIFMLAPQLMAPIQNLSGYLVMTGTAWPGILQVLDLLEQSPATDNRPGAKDLESLSPSLEARGIRFSYRPDLPPVFDGLSFSVDPQKITGLVARMGQGKTTFFRLALRFYEPQQGDVFLGGHPAGDLTQRCLRNHVALMSQFPAFFHDSLRENLLIAKPDASDDHLRRICQSTGIWNILTDKLGPDPLDAPFAAGRVLSGGQCKLLALTRCLLRDPTFVFLDEPTTGMDNSEKYALIPSLRAACQGKTVLAVDHDIPWLLKFCDSFLVLDGGKVCEQGTAADLLGSGGLFAQLHSHTQRQLPSDGPEIPTDPTFE